MTTVQDAIPRYEHSVELGDSLVSKFRLLKADEVADLLRCHLSTVYELRRSGRLKAFSLTGDADPNKRGKKGLRFLASSVDALIAGGLAEHQEAQVRPAAPEPVPVAPVPPCPPLQKTTPGQRTGSRVLLPRPR